MSNRSRAIWFVAAAMAAAGLAWWLLLPASSGLREVRLRYWSYGSSPRNPVGAWLARRVQQLDQKKHGANYRSPRLDLDGLELLWSYSSSTSGWFQFGDMVAGSNVCYWSFALPQATDPKRALAELPNLLFHGPESNYWASMVGVPNAGFQTNTVGRGGIRLPVGRSLFLRHLTNSNLTYLVQCQDIRAGLWGDMKVTFRYMSLPP